MSFFSSAGPGDRADADAELLADDVREARLAEARRAGEQHVVERLAARLRRDERDLELLLDALLADELVEPARAQRLLELLVVLVASTGRDERGSCGPPQRLPHALLGGQVVVDLGERALGVERASSRARRARRARRRGRRRRPPPTGATRRRAELLLQLEHDALGRLLADAGDRLEARGVLAHDRAAQLARPASRRRSRARPSARRRSRDSSWTKSSRSARSAKP